MTDSVLNCLGSPISPRPVQTHVARGLRRRQVSNALRGVHPAPDNARPKDEPNEKRVPKA